MKRARSGDRYLAFDLGAESGRAVLGTLNNRGILKTKEIHRFVNSQLNINGRLHWDITRLYRNIIRALIMCRVDHGGMPDSIGIDTWGVDFGLLDRRGALIGLPYSYRDHRRHEAMEHFSKVMPSARLYELTGIQLLPINTLFQLHSMKTDDDPQLEIARDLLFMPDLLNYFLTGNKQSEFTISTTSQLFNPRRGRWEKQILNALGIPAELMQDIVKPGTVIGDLSRSFGQATQLESRPVVAVASHDTAAAVAALPNPADGSAYISSGTWSLVGIEALRPVMDDPAFAYNISNEGGVEGRFRVLKNIMGLWLLQSLRRSWSDAEDLDYETLVNLAAKEKRFTAVIDVDDPVFLNPTDMAEAIVKFCRRTRQHAPHRTGQFVRIILEGLALAYRQAILQLQHLGGRPIKQIHIIGGGCKNGVLCQLTADATSCPVLAGPAEAAAIGNLLVQAMAFRRVSSLMELRKVVADSYEIQHYEPRSTSDWIEASQFLNRIKERKNAIA